MHRKRRGVGVSKLRTFFVVIGDDATSSPTTPPIATAPKSLSHPSLHSYERVIGSRYSPNVCSPFPRREASFHDIAQLDALFASECCLCPLARRCWRFV
jgi:hypothetical protein